MEVQKEPMNQKGRGISENAEIQIKKLMDNFRAAVLARDVDKIMSFYSSDVVAFDIIPPLQYIGAKAYRKSWEKAFLDSASSENWGYDIENLKITANEDVAFCHGLNHCYGSSKDGKKMDMWMRSTHCFKRQNDKWLITHEQFSVPVDFETGKAVMDLKPEKTNLH